MNKRKYFIFLGKEGLSYYSWLFIVLFVGLIVTYEGTDKINWLAIGILVIFFILFGYTISQSYYSKDGFKLPYSKRKQISAKPKLLYHWRIFSIYQVKITQVKSYLILRLEKKVPNNSHSI